MRIAFFHIVVNCDKTERVFNKENVPKLCLRMSRPILLLRPCVRRSNLSKKSYCGLITGTLKIMALNFDQDVARTDDRCGLSLSQINSKTSLSHILRLSPSRSLIFSIREHHHVSFYAV
jgi:hypothetical protein